MDSTCSVGDWTSRYSVREHYNNSTSYGNRINLYSVRAHACIQLTGGASAAQGWIPGEGPGGTCTPPTQPDTEILIIEILVGLSVLAKSVYHCVHRPIGVGSGGARGRLAPPSFKLGGHRPPTLPTVYIMNFIAVL